MDRTTPRQRHFQAWVQFLVDELERVFPHPNSDTAKELIQRFHKAVNLERTFFDVAY